MTTDDKPQDAGASVSPTSQAEPVSRLGPSRFDPSRREQLTYEIHHLARKAHRLAKQIATMTYDGMVAGRPRSKMLSGVERDATTIHGLAEAMIAIAMEARQGRDGVTRLDGEAATARASEGGIAHD
jgi:hypothetical protein